jgi:hypothetical protein
VSVFIKGLKFEESAASAFQENRQLRHGPNLLEFGAKHHLKLLVSLNK